VAQQKSTSTCTSTLIEAPTLGGRVGTPRTELSGDLGEIRHTAW